MAAARALSTDEEDLAPPRRGQREAEELVLITPASAMTTAQRHRALLRTLHVSSEDIAAADEDADFDDETSLVAPPSPSRTRTRTTSMSRTDRTDDFCDTTTPSSDSCSHGSRPPGPPTLYPRPPTPTLPPSPAPALPRPTTPDPALPTL